MSIIDVVIGLIVIFLFIKLRTELGRFKSDKTPNILKGKKSENLAAALLIQAEEKEQADRDIAELNRIVPEVFRDSATVILKRLDINIDRLISGAINGFETFTTSFANGDEEAIKKLSSKKVADIYVESIRNRKAMNQTLSTTIIKITLLEFVSVSTSVDKDEITLKLSSEQIDYISNKAGDIISGSGDKIVLYKFLVTYQMQKDNLWKISSIAKV